MLESVLNSGLLHGNQKAVQGFRAVATSDVIGAEGDTGRAVELDRQLAASYPGLPRGLRRCVVLATALFSYSLVSRSSGRQGVTRAELLSVLFRPDGVPFTQAAEALTSLVDEVEGLGALDVLRGGKAPVRYLLTISQTLPARPCACTTGRPAPWSVPSSATITCGAGSARSGRRVRSTRSAMSRRQTRASRCPRCSARSTS